MPKPQSPPVTLTPRILSLVAEICEKVGHWSGEGPVAPRLRRENRIRTIQASLAIENNSLSLDQVTAILEGKRVLGSPREIQEGRIAIECYEIEFIHPFADGNGRMGRLWQSLALSSWHAELAYVPVESLISDRQSEYHAALGAADRLAEATPFVEFMLMAIRAALEALPPSDPVSDPVKLLLQHLGIGDELTGAALHERLNLKHKPAFRKNYLNPALASGVIEMTHPGSPNSPVQRYRLTPKGRRLKP